jgi:hypothetical protein
VWRSRGVKAGRKVSGGVGRKCTVWWAAVGAAEAEPRGAGGGAWAAGIAVRVAVRLGGCGGARPVVRSCAAIFGSVRFAALR